MIERLHWLLGHSVLTYLGPLLPTGDAAALPEGEPQRHFDQRLLAATASGLPLVRRPYEALGAMLGVAGDTVLERLRGMLREGLLAQIGVLPEQTAAARHAA